MPDPTSERPTPVAPSGPPRRRLGRLAVVAFLGAALVAFLIAALLVTIFRHKEEARHRWVRLVEVDESTTDPAVWGRNWPDEYDRYRRTVDVSRTRFGGSEALPAQKLEQDPWLRRMYAGYAFSLDYRTRRGHAYMLYDQEHTERVLKKPQPGACLHCHASILPAYRSVGQGDVMKGFELINAMPYRQAHDLTGLGGKRLIAHPVSCVDCHDPQTMQTRVTRPGFINGIKSLKASQGIADYDPNRDATRQEMRSFVCGQCHVEYYFRGETKQLTYPWSRGLKIEQIEAYYDEAGYSDWTHAETGARVLKTQHPEFELWNQGIHARSGVACADCHMPYLRVGATKISDHWVRSPLLNVNRACQTCHHFPEQELLARAETIQDRTHQLMQRAAAGLVDLLDAVAAAKQAGASEAQLAPALTLQRRAQWRLDFISSENSMGFHAPQEAARILAEAVDFARQGQLAARSLVAAPGALPAPSAPIAPPADGAQPTAPGGGAPVGPGSGTP